ncbi:MAG: RraA family protein [Proteobacteria bacterium]|nr:RraA family protein [Burkholderiales bacterium]
MSIGFRIHPRPPRPASSLVARFDGIVCAHLSDNMARLAGADAALRPWHKGGQLLGVALTVRVPAGDNLMVHKAIDIAEPGDVIIVDAGGATAQAIIGEIMSSMAAARGAVGIVIDGAIRDAGALAAGTFPVYARAATHRGPYKNGPGELHVPVSIGGMIVYPNDIVIGDEDGLVAVRPDEAIALLAAARAWCDKEDKVLKSIRAREPLDRTWVDEALRSKGCEGVDAATEQ